MRKLADAEVLYFPGATLSVLQSDKTKSLGFLYLEPMSSLPRHNRPVEEWLVQVEGTSVVNIYEDEKLAKKVTLRRGDSLKIPADQFHQHTNPHKTPSLTSWHFAGDIRQVIETLRRDS